MSLNARDNQAEKPKAIAPQARTHSLPSGQSEASGRAWTEWKQMRQGRRGYKKASPTKSQEDTFETDVSEGNNSQAGEARKEAQQEAPKKRRWNGPSKRDVSKVTYYNCNKKSYYAKYCTEPKD